MRKAALIYELPSSLSPENFIAQLSALLPLQIASQQIVTKTFYDSFDWRLYHAGMFCEFDQSESCSRLSLQNIAHPQELMAMELNAVPRFAHEFTRQDFREELALVLKMRALLNIGSIQLQHTQINILNNDQKTILRLHLDSSLQLPARVSAQLIKGYDKSVLPMLNLLQADLGLTPTKQPLLLETLKVQGKTAGTYSSKLNIRLDPEMPAEVACKYIYSHLLKTIQLNEQGCIEQIDSEFLHDFRVAVRRTRAGFGQMKQVLPTHTQRHFADFFGWLGQITSPVRDIDVFLLNFQHFKQSLPISIREDINPLWDYLCLKQNMAYQQLARHLQSTRYLKTLVEWEDYLRHPSAKNPQEAFAKIPIKRLADRCIWKVYKRLLKEAKAIDPETKPEMLHSLRKTAKKLRYLMEFFQQLYAEMDINNLLKSLKELQEVLGDFQDHEVQIQALKQFSIDLKDQGATVETFLAMGVLIQILDQRRHKVRQAFGKSFEHFVQPKNRQIFKELFAPVA